MEKIDLCRCCLRRPPDKDMKTPYVFVGKPEIYADMIKECFEINLSKSTQGECGICEECVGRLRESSDFKQQVLQCQAELQGLLDMGVCVKEEETAEVKSEGEDFEELIDFNEDVKSEISDPLPSGDERETEATENETTLDKETRISNLSKTDPFQDEDLSLSCVTKKERVSEVRFKKKNTCEKCGRQFSKKINFLKHQAMHKRIDATRDICDKEFIKKSQLVDHQRKRSKPYKCHFCDKSYVNKGGLYKHRRLMHVEEITHDCNVCGKQFIEINDLLFHKRKHTGPSGYVCDMCNARFMTKKSLISHLGKKHQGIKTLRCKLCSERFYNYRQLMLHNHSHTGETYKCNECHKIFTYKHTLAQHMKIHSTRKQYSCDYCGKKLVKFSSLKRHELIHTGEKPFCCETCHKSFRHKSTLVSHQQIHTGEKSHCCEVCGKQFSRTDSLRTHLKIHVVGIRYSCELCTKSYSTKEGLRQHSRTHKKNKTISKVKKNQGKKKKDIDKKKDKSRKKMISV